MRRILFLVLMLSSVGAWAEDYYWVGTSSPYDKNSYISAVAACQAQNGTNPAAPLVNVEIAPSGTSAMCWQRRMSDGYEYGSSVIRRGDSCPEGAEYNATGGCDAPEPSVCEAKADTTQPFSRSGSGSDEYMFISSDGKFSAPSQSACFSGCLATTVEQRCITLSSGSYGCRGVAEFTGSECGAGGESPIQVEESDTPFTPDPAREVVDKPCIYTLDGNVSSCQSEKSVEQQGQQCGLVNGVASCVGTQPSKNGIEITTTLTKTDNPDGTTTEVKKDVAQVTKCEGAKCQTTTTTNTSTVIKDGAGNVIDSTGSCSGPACSDGGNPDGDGTGIDDCLENCADGFGGPDLEDTPGFGETTEAFYTRVSNSPLLSAIDGIQLQGSGSCSFGSASTAIGVISLDYMCQNSNWLDPLYYVFLAIWGFAAVRVLMSA